MPKYKHNDRDEWVITATGSAEDKRLSADDSWSLVTDAPSIPSIVQTASASTPEEFPPEKS
ncbi:MAG: hypothetical protein ACREOZ_02215 [Gloeomargaritales cyanobacterium]